MKLHDLKPAAGSRRPRTRVGRGIAAGQGKTAGRGTKGQRARAGASIPPWFEGGQTPIHVRVPKLHGFKNRFRIEFAVVNVGQISAYAEAGRFGVEAEQAAKPAAKGKAAGGAVVTVNAEVLAQAGLIRAGDKPLKVLGQGDVSQKLFVAAQAFSASARRKIEDAGGFVQVLGLVAEESAAGVPAPAAVAAALEEAAPATAAEVAPPAAAAKATTPAAEATLAAEAASPAAKPRARAAKTAAAESQSPSTTGEIEQPAATEAPAAKPRRRAAKSDEQG